MGKVYDLGGASRISVNGVLQILGKLSGKELKVKYEPRQAGDPAHTVADTIKAKKDLNFKPGTDLEKGLTKM